MTEFLLAALLLFAGDGEPEHIDSTVVSASKAGSDTPVVSVNVSSAQLQAQSPSNSLPMSLSLQPSVVAASESGSGLGYTNLRIRGVGGSQTNVTLNGITLNDAESQQVFWVNIPALSAILGSVQVQRGLGTSAAGPGAFGASLNMNTTSIPDRPGCYADFGGGSFMTFTGTVSGHSGVFNNGLWGSAAYSYQHTDGYMRGGVADVQSAYAQVGWKGRRDLVKFTFLHGTQRSGITWEGCPWDKYETDRRFNPAQGATDNFHQSHFQFNYVHIFPDAVSWSTTLNYTRGDGYYEYPADGWEGSRDYTANNLWVLRSELAYDVFPFRLSGGAYLSNYDCHHWGRSIEPDALNYSNQARKAEMDIWARAEYKIRQFTLYGDLQYRGVLHNMDGPDEYGGLLDFHLKGNFFNPRAGASWKSAGGHKVFASIAWGHREPSRSDLQANGSVKPEKLLDIEAGWNFEREKWSAGVTLYDMEYFDMLIETAELDAMGYPIKTNVPRAWRRGIELEGAYKPWEFLRFEGNLTYSGNRVKDGSEILLSPSLIFALAIRSTPWKGGSLDLCSKYTGRQQWDNSGSPDRVVPAFFTADLNAAHSWKIGPGRLRIAAYVSNLFNARYYAYAYKGGVFPAPPINASLRISWTM